MIYLLYGNRSRRIDFQIWFEFYWGSGIATPPLYQKDCRLYNSAVWRSAILQTHDFASPPRDGFAFSWRSTYRIRIVYTASPAAHSPQEHPLYHCNQCQALIGSLTRVWLILIVRWLYEIYSYRMLTGELYLALGSSFMIIARKTFGFNQG